MKLTFLGTSAGEQYPGLWCKCKNCAAARKLKGKNIRRHAALFIEDVNCLIDFPPDISHTADINNVPLNGIKHLLMTHSDADHLFPFYFRWRYCADEAKLPFDYTITGPRCSKIAWLNVYGNQVVLDLIKKELKEDESKFAITLKKVEPFQRYAQKGFSFIPLRANHRQTEEALNYRIDCRGKRLLYLLDTGWFLDETSAFIRKSQYDCVIIESTYGFYKSGMAAGHFDFTKLKKAHDFFVREKLLKRGAVFIATHFSPHHAPLHGAIVKLFHRDDVLIAYDGLKITI
jgi:phosphoribosyl 1,2-cyclic phosphate phosphodiesterase